MSISSRQKRVIISITVGLTIGIYAFVSKNRILSPLLAQNQYETELLILTNIQRKKVGLSQLQMSSQLNQAALIHAQDLVKYQFASHTGSDGLSPSDRAQKVGYPSTYIGENIAIGRLNPTETIDGWMKNTQHRSNILNPKYTDTGLAYINAPETKYRYYWVQIFGQKTLISREQVADPSQTPSPSPSVNSNQESCEGEKIFSALMCPGDSLNDEETELYELINQYRTQQGLSSIPLSPSLSRVANRHLQDLQDNLKLYDRNGKDWRFGWSNCSYNANNPSTFPCMWAAPQRLKTAYIGKAYEVLCGGKEEIYSQEALRCWQKSNSNNNVILNQEEWSNYEWKAIGVAIDKGYANLWFGQDIDRANQNPNPPKPVPRPGRIW